MATPGGFDAPLPSTRRPTGTVTFLFTDIEGSTRLWQAHPEAMATAVARHDEILRAAIAAHAGTVFSTGGDGVCAAFFTAPDALSAATEAQGRFLEERWGGSDPIRVRMALHTGVAEERDGDYFGPTLNRCARVVSIAHGGQVLCSQVTADLVRDDLPPSVTLADLGEHRLRDLTTPERVYQACLPGQEDAFPPLRSLGSSHHQLPVPPTSFVGREPELQSLAKLLDEHRLVVLTGIGGCGKTRLALELGNRQGSGFPDRVFFVDLSLISDPEAVPSAIAVALGLMAGGVPEGSVKASLLAAVASLRALLLLDNCEHLVDACAEMVTDLLAAAPNLKILATSREGLGVEGEHAWPVPSLELAAADASDSVPPALKLFEERAAAGHPSFVVGAHNLAAVTEICTRLDGLPLAIELAAARVSHLSPAEIAARLDDRFRLLTGGRRRVQRQQTLQGAMDWSYDLLNEDEQVLLRRLAVISGTFDLRAVEGVCAESPENSRAIVDLLGSLVNKSLVVADTETSPVRYRLLETVRLYAEDRLVGAGEAEQFRARHRDWYLAWVESFPPDRAWLSGTLVEVFVLDYPNLRAAVEWSVGEHRYDLVGRLAAGLFPLWRNTPHYEEGDRWLRAALGAGDQVAPETRLACLAAASFTAMILLAADGEQLARVATELAVGQPDHALVFAWAMAGLQGSVRAEATRDAALAEESVRCADEAVRLARERLPAPWIIEALTQRGMVLLDLGRYDDAASSCGEAVALASSEDDNLWALTPARTAQAIAYHLTGRDREALGAVQALVDDFRRFGTQPRAGSGLSFATSLAVVLAANGDTSEARHVLRMGAGAAGLAPVPLGMSDHLMGFAVVAAIEGQWERASRLLAAAIEEGRGRPIPFRTPQSYALYRSYVTRVREALGSDRARGCREEGRSMSRDEAVAYAFSE